MDFLVCGGGWRYHDSSCIDRSTSARWFSMLGAVSPRSHRLKVRSLISRLCANRFWLVFSDFRTCLMRSPLTDPEERDCLKSTNIAPVAKAGDSPPPSPPIWKIPIRGALHLDVFSVSHRLEKGAEAFHGQEPHPFAVFQINIDAVEHRQQQAVALTWVGCFP